MAPRKVKTNLVARLVTDNTLPCAFCNRDVDDEVLYGKLYAIGDIQCHYFCVLLSSCLMQKGKDEHGLFGFLYEDILTEVERCKKHKCSYCNQVGANLGCSISQCRKQFHLPCGKEKNSVSLFYGNYKSFCQNHAPKQQIPESIMIKAKARRSRDNKIKKMLRQDCNVQDLKDLKINDGCVSESDSEYHSVCVICYEQVDGYPTINTFWPPCCAKDAWFHRNCLQRMALSAGMHYLKCPLCNDKAHFYEAVISQGYYVPDRDAAWELEQNAFAEIYERPVTCSAVQCACPMGRSHDADIGSWSIRVCALCGSSGEHAGCSTIERPLHICVICEPHAPANLEYLANIETGQNIGQTGRPIGQNRRRGPVMPSRMSLRRTKQHGDLNRPPSAQSVTHDCQTESQTSPSNSNKPQQSRDNTSTTKSPTKHHFSPPKAEMGPKSPMKLRYSPTKAEMGPKSPMKLRYSPTKAEMGPKSPIKLHYSPTKAEMGPKSPIKVPSFDSPTKILEEGLKNKFGSKEIVVKDTIVDELRRRFKKPRPLSVKRRIVNDLVNGLLDLLPQPQDKDSECTSETTDSTNDDVIMLEEPQEIIDLTDKEEPNHEMLQPGIEPHISPSKSKKVDIETHSSLEIFAKDEKVNIDVIKIDNNEKAKSSKKTSFKFTPCQNLDKKIHLDVDTFKNEYLNEVTGSKIVEQVRKMAQKRKLDKDKIVFEYESKKRNLNRRSISIKNKNIQVKIKWRKEQVKLQFNNMAKKDKKYRQYVLKYSPCKEEPQSSKACSMISKPEGEVTPLKKRKYVKQEKSPDNLVQTSIDKFFKLKSPSNEN